MSRSRSRSPTRRSGGTDRLRSDRVGGGDRGGNRIDQKSDRMVYLSNLPWELTWMELKDIIREKAGEVNFVEVLEGRDGRSKGCAVVEFKRREGALKCVENMHRTELRERLIIAKEIRDPVAFFRKVREDTGIDFLGGGDRPERSRFNDRGSGAVTINENETYGLSPSFLRQLNISTPLCNRVFITNISYNCGVGRIFDICALAGRVTWLDLQMDKEGKTKGMAVCEYSHPIEAVQAVSMLNNQRVFDRTIAVRMDRFPKEVERREGGLPLGLRAIGMGLGANGAPLTDVASVISSINPGQQQMGLNGAAATAPINPFGTTSNPFGPSANVQPVQPASAPVSSYAAPTDHGLGSGGGGGGHFQSTAQNAYQSHASGGFFNATQGAQQVQRPTPGVPQFTANQYAPKQMSSGTGATFGPPQAVAQQTQKYESKYEPKYDVSTTGGGYGGYGAATPVAGAVGGGSSGYETSRVILIKNLPVDYTWQIVSDRVQQFGDLESVEMITPGVAKVRFVQLKDAERAKVTLQGTTVEGRAIGIEYL